MTDDTIFKNIFNNLLEKIELRLFDYIENHKPDSLYEPFKYIISGSGKRIRPVLAMISAGVVGGDPNIAIDSACAIEILHNFTLVHDDIMDNSQLRRNKPTIHNKWDEATAILVGDVMVGYAYKLLPSLDKHERANDILKEFSSALIEVCEGQAYDMNFNKQKSLSIDEYLLMIDKKTAKILEASAVIGGNLGNGNINEINVLREFSHNLGIAFQIQDDFLDITADEAKLGKSIGQDIVEGKKTYLIIKAIEKAKEKDDIELLNKFINNNGLPKEFIPKIQELFEKLNIYKETQDIINLYYSNARKSLTILKENEYTQTLNWLIDTLSNRIY